MKVYQSKSIQIVIKSYLQQLSVERVLLWVWLWGHWRGRCWGWNVCWNVPFTTDPAFQVLNNGLQQTSTSVVVVVVILVLFIIVFVVLWFCDYLLLSLLFWRQRIGSLSVVSIVHNSKIRHFGEKEVCQFLGHEHITYNKCIIWIGFLETIELSVSDRNPFNNFSICIENNKNQLIRNRGFI